MTQPHIDGMPVGALQTNCFVLGCPETKKAAIFDCGGDPRGMAKLATDHGYEIEKIFLTHAHIDHVAGLGELVELTGAPIYLHRADEGFYQQAPAQGRRFGYDIEPLPPVDHWIADGDEVTVGTLTGRVIFLPGHSPGSVIFYFEDFSTAFSGDVLFAGSIGRVDLPGSSPDDMRASLARLKEELPDDTRILCGHGPETTVGMEKQRNPFLLQDW